LAILRVLIDGPRPGAVNMSVDADLLARHSPGDDPVLRLYRWSPYAVSMGHHQREEEFAADRIAARGFDLVRRPTGGRAILHSEELTYAVVGSSPSDLFGSTLNECYEAINRALILFLEKLGLRPDVSGGESLAEARGLVCFRSAGRHELMVAGRKIIGSAQRRTEGVFLQHGTILAGPAHVDLLDCLAGGGNTPEARAELIASTTDLGSLLGGPLDSAAVDRCNGFLVDAFAENFDLEPVVTKVAGRSEPLPVSFLEPDTR